MPARIAPTLVNARIMRRLMPDATPRVHDDGQLAVITQPRERAPAVTGFLLSWLIGDHRVHDQPARRRRVASVQPAHLRPIPLRRRDQKAARATIDWFEHRGKERLLEDYRDCVWYADFLEFVGTERLFAKMGTPAREAHGDRDKRWDTSRISAFSEVLAFYGLDYWYAWQVTILGLGPIWQSENASARSRAAQWLDSGAVFAFGLSEREHGADIYTTDMVLRLRCRHRRPRRARAGAPLAAVPLGGRPNHPVWQPM